MASSFSAFTPTYERLSNRMARLQQMPSQHNTSYIRSSSTPKLASAFPLSPPMTLYTPPPSCRQHPPTCASIQVGKVTKNTGLRKYNQRQLKAVMNSTHSQ